MFKMVQSLGLGCAAGMLICNMPAGADAQENSAAAVVAASSARVPPILLPVIPLEDLNARLRTGLVASLPEQLTYESLHNWGHQAEVPSLRGLRPITVLRNHGDWEKARVVTRKLPRHLDMRVGELLTPADKAVEFTVHLWTPAVVELNSETWQNGIRVWSGSARAVFSLAADLTVQAEQAPDGILHFRLVESTLSTRSFVAENINGFGGEWAKLSSGRTERSFKPWQPAILGEFQRTLSAALATLDANPELQTVARKLMDQAMDARKACLAAHTTTVVLRPALPTTPPPVVPEATSTSQADCLVWPAFVGGFAIAANRTAIREGVPRENAAHLERWALVEQAIRYVGAASAGSHPGGHSGGGGGGGGSAPAGHKK